MTDKLVEIKGRWLKEELHRPEYWADLASRDVPSLITEADEARDLARKMYKALAQFPTSVSDLIGPEWPEEPPEWLYERLWS